MSRPIARHGLHPRRLGPVAYTLATVALSVALTLGVVLAFLVSPWWLLASLAVGVGFAIWPGWDVEMTCPEPDCARYLPAWRRGEQRWGGK